MEILNLQFSDDDVDVVVKTQRSLVPVLESTIRLEPVKKSVSPSTTLLPVGSIEASIESRYKSSCSGVLAVKVRRMLLAVFSIRHIFLRSDSELEIWKYSCGAGGYVCSKNREPSVNSAPRYQ